MVRDDRKEGVCWLKKNSRRQIHFMVLNFKSLISLMAKSWLSHGIAVYLKGIALRKLDKSYVCMCAICVPDDCKVYRRHYIPQNWSWS